MLLHVSLTPARTAQAATADSGVKRLSHSLDMKALTQDGKPETKSSLPVNVGASLSGASYSAGKRVRGGAATGVTAAVVTPGRTTGWLPVEARQLDDMRNVAVLPEEGLIYCPIPKARY